MVRPSLHRAGLGPVWLACALLFAVSGCASTPQDRGPWHQYLHDHGLE